MLAVSPARKAAFAILIAVEQGHGHSDDLLRSKRVDKLSPADRNLATALVLGTLRWQLDLDKHIRPLLKHPNAKIDAEVLVALRLGAFQLMHLNRIPAHAAIDESVELTKQAGHRFASGMVNAVLRKIPRTGSGRQIGEILIGIGTELDPVEAYPEWMVERWTGFYGLDAARAICLHGQNPPFSTVRIPDSAVEQELAANSIRLEPSELLSEARFIASGDVTATSAFREGRARLQDEGSQLVAEIVPRGSTILDCCAAPGGKTLILAERNPLARIVACESSSPRLDQLKKRLELAGNRVECRLVDATQLADESAFDVALADVPCSGTGTLGRNPEIRHRLRSEDLARHAERQKAILRTALHAVRPGGCVIYSTCSLEPEENEQVVTAVLESAREIRLVPMSERIDALLKNGIVSREGARRLLACVTPEGYLRLLPGAFRTDGFFVALLEKPAREGN
jgi:16S rRNA (cytosine967-C5)-methyltransferase